MPFIITALAALGGGSALAGGITAAGALGSAYGAIKGASNASSQAQQAGQASQVDISALDEQTRRIAKQNALDSAALEQQLTPEVPQLRTAANQGVLSGLNPTTGETASTNLLLGNLGKPAGEDISASPLLQSAISRAQSNLDLGGRLPQDVQNLVTRTALAHAGAVGGGLGLGRDIAARDLGLTSLDIQNQRLSQAASLGGQQTGIDQFNVGTHFGNANNLLQQIQMLQQISQGQFGRQLAGAQYGNSIQQPIVGLDPTSVGNIAIGNQNNSAKYLAQQANLSGAQGNSYLNLAGQFLGAGLNGLSKYKPAGTPSTASTYPII